MIFLKQYTAYLYMIHINTMIDPVPAPSYWLQSKIKGNLKSFFFPAEFSLTDIKQVSQTTTHFLLHHAEKYNRKSLLQKI